MISRTQQQWFDWAVLVLLACVGALYPDSAEAKKKRSLKNTVTFTIGGGDSNALALCLNAAKADDTVEDTEQANICKNHVKSKGGDVVIKNATLVVIVANDTDG